MADKKIKEKIAAGKGRFMMEKVTDRYVMYR